MWKPRLASLLFFALSLITLWTIGAYPHLMVQNPTVTQFAMQLLYVFAVIGLVLGLFGVITSFLLVPSGDRYVLNTENILGRFLFKIHANNQSNEVEFCFVSFSLAAISIFTILMSAMLGGFVYMAVLDLMLMLSILAITAGVAVIFGYIAMLYRSVPRVTVVILVAIAGLLVYFSPNKNYHSIQEILAALMFVISAAVIFGLLAYLHHVLKKTMWYAKFCPKVTVQPPQVS